MYAEQIPDVSFDAVQKLSRDMKQGAERMSPNEARFLVSSYYLMQDSRIRTNNQLRAIEKSADLPEILGWYRNQFETLEKQIAGALGYYAKGRSVGRWAMSVKGIGPVITAGLLAHIDIEQAPTVGHIWRFAGLDPTQTWEKGQKRPWNAELKTLCWKIGESFVKVSGYEDAFYGKVYRERKELEQKRNEAGGFADQAAAVLEKKRFGKTTEAYKHYSAGRLPPAHIHARAKRYAVKLFLAHFHEQWYRLELGKEPPLPYVIEHLGHVHKVPVPGAE